MFYSEAFREPVQYGLCYQYNILTRDQSEAEKNDKSV